MEAHRPDTSGRFRPSRLLLKPKQVGDEQKRASERTTTTRTVRARVEGQEPSVEVPLINISPTGLQLSVGQDVDPETTLLIEVAAGKSLRAMVRWCREDGENRLLGAEWETPITFDEVWKIRSDFES